MWDLSWCGAGERAGQSAEKKQEWVELKRVSEGVRFKTVLWTLQLRGK